MAIKYCVELFGPANNTQGVLVAFTRAEDRLHFLKTINIASNVVNVKLFSADDDKPIFANRKERNQEINIEKEDEE